MLVTKENLFRPEVSQSAARRLQGEIALTCPLSWRLMGTVSSILLIGAVGAALSAQYPIITSGRYIVVAPAQSKEGPQLRTLSASILLTPEQAFAVKPGQRAVLSFDALPSTTFGSVDAKIVSVMCRDVAGGDGTGRVVPSCNAMASLDKGSLEFRGIAVRIGVGYVGNALISLGEQPGTKWLLGKSSVGRGQ